MKLPESQGRNYLLFVFYEIILQVFAQILEAHVIENMITYYSITTVLQKEYQNDVWSLDVARAAQEDTSIASTL